MVCYGSVFNQAMIAQPRRSGGGRAQFDLVAKKARPKALKHVRSNSFGFGGINAPPVFSAV